MHKSPVDFAYYRDDYMGSRIPEKAFDALAARASEVLAVLCRNYVVMGGEDCRKMAICSMAEGLYNAARNRGVAASTAGNTSVRYDPGTNSDRALRRELYRRAGIYLDIYRGVVQ